MVSGINSSVGISGANSSRDVKTVQTLINVFAACRVKLDSVKVDGRIGKNTIDAIKIFQKNSAGIKFPDGRVDPNGKTFRYLTMYLSDQELKKIVHSAQSAKPVDKSVLVTAKKIDSLAGLHNYQVTYKDTVPANKRIVSMYALDVIRMALKESGMNHAVITSTIRTPEEQAGLMLRNAKINLQKQNELYGTNGRDVLLIYEINKTKKDNEILELMIDQIKYFDKEKKRVSKHCVSVDAYKKKNIIDIGLNSTKKVSKNFNKSKFTNALNDLKKNGYIDKMIDETNKSNQCWHIEVTPNKKIIHDFNFDSILNQTRFINRIC